MPAPRFDHAACRIGTDVYVWGGVSRVPSPKDALTLAVQDPDPTDLLRDLHRLDLKTLRWSRIDARDSTQPCPLASFGSTLTPIGSCLYLFGGRVVDASGGGSTTKPSNQLFRFDVLLQAWTSIDAATMPAITSSPIVRRRARGPPPRSHHIAFARYPGLWVVGGRGIDCFSDVRIFDVEQGAWVQHIEVSGHIPHGRFSAGWAIVGEAQATAAGTDAAATAHEPKLICFGGRTETKLLEDVCTLSLPPTTPLPPAVSFTASLSWSSVPTLGRRPNPRAGHTSFAVGDKIIFFGGIGMHAAAIEPQTRLAGRSGSTRPVELLSASLSLDVSRWLAACASAGAEAVMPISYTLHDFDQLHTLGTGSFGRVKFVRHRSTGVHYALKILEKSEILRLKQVEHTINERSVLASVKHPFIVEMVASFQDTRYVYLVLEYVVGGEFFSLLRKYGRLQERHAAFYAAHIVLIYQYLHSKDTLYRDLKPEVRVAIARRSHTHRCMILLCVATVTLIFPCPVSALSLSEPSARLQRLHQDDRLRLRQGRRVSYIHALWHTRVHRSAPRTPTIRLMQIGVALAATSDVSSPSEIVSLSPFRSS